LRHADKGAGSASRDALAAAADLSDRKHEDFGRSSGTPARAADMRAAIFINHVLDNLLRYAAIDTPALRLPMR
jgi:hypothetical protein